MLLMSIGHSLLTPLHVSARSQSPADARHTNPFGCTVSAGQAALPPVHFSLKSHSMPALAARRDVIPPRRSAGQVGSPLQVSAMSQSPAPSQRHV